MSRPVDLLALRALPLRLLDRLEPRPAPPGCPVPGPCVCWVGTRLSRNGYGRAWCPDRRCEPPVHVQVWRLLIGPVTPGLVLDHRCRVRRCAAPWHLEPVTVRENTRRGEAKLFQPALNYLRG